jgi:Fz domain
MGPTPCSPLLPLLLLLLALSAPGPCSASVHSGYDSAISMIGEVDGEGADGEWTGVSARTPSSSSAASTQQHSSTASSSRPSRCIDIPTNFTLCHGIQYQRMHLPNLLDHESIDEALEQSAAWMSLLRLHCHSDARLFLCSLFAPICLDEPAGSQPMKIQPCQSLCQSVKAGCEERMQQYGFPWPEILRCSKFPLDNDLCIRVPAAEETPPSVTSVRDGGSSLGASVKKERTVTCKSCAQVPTFENLMDSYCRSATGVEF